MTPPPPPVIEGPAIRFQRVTFNFVTPSDSVFLSNTKGDYSLADRIFSGEEGTFNWSAALLPPDEVYCNFMAYSFSSRKPELKADLVKFNYTDHTPGLIYGKFEFRPQPRKDSVPSSWPRFVSYENNIAITGFGNERMKFRGGFSLTGNRISSKNVNNDYSALEVTDSVGVIKFRARSRDFVFTDSTVSASGTAISIYQGNDSVSHPSLRMHYNWRTNQLVLTAEKGTMRHAPFTASFFGMEFSADRIRWNINADSLNIDITGGRSSVPMVLESFDYYSPEDFYRPEAWAFPFIPWEW